MLIDIKLHIKIDDVSVERIELVFRTEALALAIDATIHVATFV